MSKHDIFALNDDYAGYADFDDGTIEAKGKRKARSKLKATKLSLRKEIKIKIQCKHKYKEKQGGLATWWLIMLLMVDDGYLLNH